jgi:hypothetical protein
MKLYIVSRNEGGFYLPYSWYKTVHEVMEEESAQTV